MSDEELKKLVPNEGQSRKLAKAKSLSKEEAVKFVETISKEGGKTDIDAAAKALDEIKPSKVKPDPSALPPQERKKALVSALEKAKSSFSAKINAAFEEFGGPETVDAWLKDMAEEMLVRLSK